MEAKTTHFSMMYLSVKLRYLMEYQNMQHGGMWKFWYISDGSTMQPYLIKRRQAPSRRRSRSSASKSGL